MKNITGQIEYIKCTKQAPILLLPPLALRRSLESRGPGGEAIIHFKVTAKLELAPKLA